MPRLALIGTLALASMAAPATASAADRVWIEGRGFGHGIGLSQEGARGFAAHGFAYRRILGHYYRGTAVGRLSDGRSVRVLLGSGGPAAFSGASDVGGVRLRPARTYTAVALGGGRLEVRLGRRAVARGPAPLRVRGAGPLNVAGGTYRGVLDLTAGGGGGEGIKQRRPGGDGGGWRAGHQPARAGGLRARGRLGREPGVVAGRDLEGPGGGGARLRDHHVARRRLRPVRRHPFAGLPRGGRRDRPHRRGGARHARPGRDLSPAGRDHLLLLDLGRPHRERRGLVRRRRPQAVAARRAGSL